MNNSTEKEEKKQFLKKFNLKKNWPKFLFYQKITKFRQIFLQKQIYRFLQISSILFCFIITASEIFAPSIFDQTFFLLTNLSLKDFEFQTGCKKNILGSKTVTSKKSDVKFLIIKI